MSTRSGIQSMIRFILGSLSSVLGRILGQRAGAPLLLPLVTCRIDEFGERAPARARRAFSLRSRGTVARVSEQFRYAHQPPAQSRSRSNDARRETRGNEPD